jgi:hypothetical protein
VDEHDLAREDKHERQQEGFSCKEQNRTYAIGQILHQVLDLKVAGLDLGV